MVLKVLDSEQDHGKWWFSQRNAQGEVMLTLHSPADAPVGLYSMTVVLLSADGQILEQTEPQTFYLLFNPWCKGEELKKIAHPKNHFVSSIQKPFNLKDLEYSAEVALATIIIVLCCFFCYFEA